MMRTLFIENPSTDPYFNIATEEYLLRNFSEDIVMIWRSQPSVITGKHQNTLAEINLPYVIKNNIPVVRRLSGGGTVFHDPGNINFTFIQQGEKNKMMVDFRKQTEPVLLFLKSLGLDARFQGKNDLRINGKKISGNAEHVFKNRVLHHGTLLYDADLAQLNQAIKAREELFNSKAIKSVRSIVSNISDCMVQPFTRNVFIEKFKRYCLSYFPGIEIYPLKSADLEYIEHLKASKYTQWEWNYGYSPRYTFHHEAEINGNHYKVSLSAEKATIVNISLVRNQLPLLGDDLLLRELTGIPHHPDPISQILKKYNFGGFRTLSDKWEMLGLFF
ncbi:MAG: biotin/lipoate A/B protein ligase family protein [Bacteroidales bacterium]